MTTTLVLIRHGEILRPTDTSDFDPAPITERGRLQFTALAENWPLARPTVLYSSPLRRALESAMVLGSAFGLPTIIKPCLREWAADTTGVPQSEYVALEKRAWADLDLVPPSGESLRMASRRARSCIESIAEAHRGETVAVVGHGTLFSLLTAALTRHRPMPAYKASIGFAHAAILTAGSRLRLLRDFAGYSTPAE